MKSKKKIIIAASVIIAVIAIVIASIFILRDENKLSIIERNWINENIKTVQNVNVVNNVNIFGSTGKGVFFDFLIDFAKNYNLEINPIAFNNGENPGGLSFRQTNELTELDTVFYKDHYVLVSKKYEIVEDSSFLTNKELGVLAGNISYVSNYLKSTNNVIYTQFATREEMISNFDSEDGVQYLIVPLVEYMDAILEKDYQIIYHFSDIEAYYTFRGVENDNLSNIVRKYYNVWSSNLDEYFKNAEFELFTNKLNITGTEVDAMRSVTYDYGFVNNSPYEIIIGGNYGGIVAMYLGEFSKFADVEFNFTKYRSFNKFLNAIKAKEIDLYYNYYNVKTDYHTVTNGQVINFDIIAKNDNDLVIKTIDSLKGKTIYVVENSLIYKYLESVGNIDLKTYNSNDKLKSIAKKDVIIALDSNVYDYYEHNELEGYTKRFTETINDQYSFKSKSDTAFYKLLNKYISTLDSEEITYLGLYNHYKTIKSGTLLSTIAQYILYILVFLAIIIYIIYRSTKRIKITKKIKKEDKIKFIDQLTSLKNRNYLNENINLWNNNKIYPQTMIVIDLNNIQQINDTLGYEEGDKQIKAVANVLIKTQLDNSDIIRTDGNEFLVYLIGYSQKQITNYIYKLNKEFKKLPYEYGAEFGYSMITDDIKTIEDAINEAVEEMKKQKTIANKED